MPQITECSEYRIFLPRSWGIDEANTRFVTSEDSQIDPERASEAQVVVWPKHHRTSVLPLVTPDTIYIGDGETVWWHLIAKVLCSVANRMRREMLRSITGGGATRFGPTLYFAHRTKGVFAVHAQSGKTLWQSGIRDEPLPMYSGSPQLLEEYLRANFQSRIGLSLPLLRLLHN